MLTKLKHVYDKLLEQSKHNLLYYKTLKSTLKHGLHLPTLSIKRTGGNKQSGGRFSKNS